MRSLAYAIFAGVAALVSIAPANALPGEPSRSSQVRTGDRAFAQGRYDDAETAYTKACLDEKIGQACQRAARFYDYEGANLRRQRANMPVSRYYFTKACASLKDAKACSIVRSKISRLKDDIGSLTSAKDQNRALIQSTIANRYFDLAGYEIALGYRRTSFITALKKNLSHANRAAQLNPSSNSRARSAQIAEKRLALHQALRRVKPAFNPTCAVTSPQVSKSRYLNDYTRCWQSSNRKQVTALQDAAKVGGVIVNSGAGEVFKFQGVLEDVSCLCINIIFEHREDIIRRFKELASWRDQQARKWGLTMR